VNRVRYQPPLLHWWRLVLLLACFTLTTGCDDLRQRAETLWPFGPAATPTPSARPISLLGWIGSEAENAQLQQGIAAFEVAHPEWPIAGKLVPDYSAALEAALDSDSPPDIFLAYSHQLADLVADRQILPIPARYPVTNGIAPNLVPALQVNGINYCFPRDVAVLALFYNPAVFDRSEVAYPRNDWSWTEFRAAIDATADLNNGFYGLVQDYDQSRFLTFLLQSSTDDDIWQGDDALQAIEYYMDLYNDEVAAVSARLDSTWNGEAFGRGRAAMTIEANWLVPYLANYFPGMDYGIVELPAGPSGRGTTAFLTCWVVNADAANAEGALALAAFLTEPQRRMAWADASGNLPPSIEEATSWVSDHPTYAPFVNALSYATPWIGPAGFLDRAAAVNLSMDAWYKDNMTTPELIGVLATMSENPPLPTPTPTATPAD
jgi:multiple sugar transport system substrate-binding protein